MKTGGSTAPPLQIRIARGSSIASKSEYANIRGRLIHILKDWTPPYPGLYLYYPGRRHLPARMRAFIELVRETNRRQA